MALWVYHVVEKMGYSYESEEAYDLMDQMAEYISYYAIDESANLAKTRGAYPDFKGSGWSKGELPVHSLDNEKDRKSQGKAHAQKTP